MISVFDFKSYKRFIEAVEESRKGYERGFRSKLSEVLSCQSGYISQVMNGEAHFSLEQALKISKYLNLKTREQKYFLTLVEFARAGTKELQSYFSNELKILLNEHLNIKERVGNSNILSDADQFVYYSSWHYLAVHVLSSLPEFSTAKSIAHALKIPDEVANQVLLFLIQSNIVVETNGVLKPGFTQVHLDRNSPLIRQHHTNWRISAIQSLVTDNKDDLHYSTVSTLSKADAEKLKADMVKFIEHYVAKITPSKEEVMYGFNMDFYNLIKR